MVKVPRFKNRNEEAAYWDVESVADHLDEMAEVEVEVKRPLTHTLSVRVDGDDLRELQAEARARGVGVTTMARMLLKEGLKRPDHRLSALAERRGSFRAGVTGLDTGTLLLASKEEWQDSVINALKPLLDSLWDSAQVSPREELHRLPSKRVKP